MVTEFGAIVPGQNVKRRWPEERGVIGRQNDAAVFLLACRETLPGSMQPLPFDAAQLQCHDGPRRCVGAILAARSIGKSAAMAGCFSRSDRLPYPSSSLLVPKFSNKVTCNQHVRVIASTRRVRGNLESKQLDRLTPLANDTWK